MFRTIRLTPSVYLANRSCSVYEKVPSIQSFQKIGNVGFINHQSLPGGKISHMLVVNFLESTKM